MVSTHKKLTSTYMNKNCFQLPQTKAGVTYKVAALDAVIVGMHTGMSIHRVAAVFGVPRMILQDKIKGRTPIEMKKGPKPYPTEEIEDRIEDWLLDPQPEINNSVNECVNDDVTEPQGGDVPVQVSDEL